MQALASKLTFQQARGKELKRRQACGERGSNSSLSHHHHIFVCHQLGNDNGIHHAENNFTECSTDREESAKGRTKAPKVHKLRFSYFALSFQNILRKVKDFYNGFLGGGDASSESMEGSEAPMLEPYFSIPVLPHP